MKSYMGFRLAYLHLTLTNSKGQGPDYVHFDDDYQGNYDIPPNSKSQIWLFVWYIWPWLILKVIVKIIHIFMVNCLEMVIDIASITIAII